MVGNVIFCLLRLLPQVTRAKAEHQALTAEKTDRRSKRQTDRKDFMRFVCRSRRRIIANYYIASHILRHNDEKGMSMEGIKATSDILIIAGSETTATLLSGATFCLLKNPSCLAKAIDEVRQAFVLTSDITFATVAARLPYLNACLEETLRMYPPVPMILARQTEPEGDIVNGRLVPPNVSARSRKPKQYQSINLYRYPLVSTHQAPPCPPAIRTFVLGELVRRAMLTEAFSCRKTRYVLLFRSNIRHRDDRYTSYGRRAKAINQSFGKNLP